MNTDDILNQLNNPKYKLNIALLLWEMHKTNINNSYYLIQILKAQLEIKELLQGKTGQEAESNVESKLNELEKKFSDYLKEDLTDDLHFFSSDD